MKYLKLLIALASIFITCAVCTPVRAQTLPQNLNSTNVDDLTDAQIRQIMQQAQASGVSDSQLIQAAEAKGLSATQAQRLQNRITDLRSKDGSSAGNTTSGDQTTSRRSLNYKPDTTGTNDTSNTTASRNKFRKSRIFGADLFRNSSSSFEPNLKLATPVNYVVGPDDQLNISVYGNSLVNWKLDVSPEGNINIPGVGVLNVSGKTIEQATEAIKGRLASSNYAVGRGTSVKVTLGDIRSIKIIMVGEVIKPGTYTLSSLATAFNALYVAGGPNDNGSFRQIEIIRNNRIVRHLDVYDFLVKGDQKDNIGLQDQDIVRVPSYRTRVEMTGEVKNPAIFETLPGETLADVIKFAGGFTNLAYTGRIKVSQISDQQRRITDVLEADYKNYIPLRGDKYTVDKILERYENRVTINGAVFRPGEYELQKGMTLLQLITNAAGLKEDAFTGRGTITRLKSDNTTELVAFNVKDVVNKVISIPLLREDVVTVASIFDLRDQYRVRISGEVRKPGDFAFAENMKVEDLIFKAGGFSEGASTLRIEVARRVDNSDPNSKTSTVANVFTVDVDRQLTPGTANFVLQPFDIVSVYSLPGYEKQRIVRVEGEVLYPGPYVLQKKNEKISDIIRRAGGLTASADADGSTLKRDNTAILGVDKNKVDTVAIAQERIERANQLKAAFKDSTNSTPILTNNFIGIDLRQIIAQPGSVTDLILEDGDDLRIPKQQQVVKVNGEVLFPSAVIFTGDKSFNDYVQNAGGYSPDALRRRAYILYPNGTVQGTRKFLFFNSHPKVKPGSQIYVPKKPVRKGLTAAELIGLTSGLASIAAVILGLISLKK